MTKVHHPAKFSPPILKACALYADGASSLADMFAGVGLIGGIKDHMTSRPYIVANELESVWAAEAYANGCDEVSIGDARNLSVHGPQRYDAIVTSPTYGNRMADAADWAEGRIHCTYTGELRRTVGDRWASLSPGNSGAMQWGHHYRQFHREAWAEAWECLLPGGRLVISIADHIRDGVAQGVPEWHVSCLLGIGFELLDWCEVETKRYGFGANSDKRCPELVILMARPGYPPVDWRLQQVGLPGHYVRSRHQLWDVWPELQQLGLPL